VDAPEVGGVAVDLEHPERPAVHGDNGNGRHALAPAEPIR
jgi:hypothetical protein